jgi:GxxExxY protein
MLRINSSLDEPTERLVGACIGCAIAVHRALGPGYMESIYRRAMRVELEACGLVTDEECRFEVHHRGVLVGVQKVDLVVGRAVILELKAVERVHDVHVSQVVAYLHGTGLRVGLLINFRVPVLKQGIRRLVR